MSLVGANKPNDYIVVPYDKNGHPKAKKWQFNNERERQFAIMKATKYVGKYKDIKYGADIYIWANQSGYRIHDAREIRQYYEGDRP